MIIGCNVTGSERKRLVQALAKLTFTDAVYAGAPTFAYQVGDYAVDKNGTISSPDTVASEAVSLLVAKLAEQGFTPVISGEEALAETPAEAPDVAPEAEAEAIPAQEAREANVGVEMPDTAGETVDGKPVDDILGGADTAKNLEDESATDTDETHLTVSIPRDKLPDEALARLRIMVSNKETLFKRALLADALPIEFSEKEVSFPWFTLTGIDGEAAAYAQFVNHLCKMAVEQTRVLDKPYDGDNDRFAMRIFMVRLGMKGAQFALARKLMMKNLTGNSGWRYGTPPKKTEETPVVLPEESSEDSTSRIEEPEILVSYALSDVEDVEEAEALVPEEISDTTANNTVSEEG